MFLDDKLLSICEKVEIESGKDVQDVYDLLIQQTQAYYVSKLHPGMPNPEAKTAINRSFALWDSFVRMAKKHKSVKVRVLGEMCEKYSFKDALLNDPKISKIYNKL